jgi:hypothetical protein
MEAIRRNLVWRLENIPSLSQKHLKRPPTIFCLPDHCRDPFGHPIIIVRGTPLEGTANLSSGDFRAVLIPTLDRLRVHLKEINKERTKGNIALQYVVLLDMEGVSIQSIVRIPSSFKSYMHLIIYERT